MSNTALKLIWRMLSPERNQWCGRAFVPAPDMEALLRERNIPLCTLEEGIPLADLDVVAVTVGFELSATNILTLLDLGGIPLESAQRGEVHPLVIGGGPAFTNPLPMGRFFDAVVIGEAEECLPDLMEKLRQWKIRKGSRQEALDLLDASPHVWAPRKSTPARRAVWNGFSGTPLAPSFPVPSLKVIQDYASVEIMRGCPQGCRFCHAGVFYRPYRRKDPARIVEEVTAQVTVNGYRHVSLASLSSGDYPGMQELYEGLNRHFAPLGVSFALPSLKVNSFTLPLLQEMSRVKKSGLTFAVETPTEEGQRALNKTVGISDTLAIMQEAKSLGWKSAKLYFMTGLPFGNPEEDVDGIIALVTEIRRKVGISLNLSIGTFVPKPHTPYQWAPQCAPEKAFQAFLRLKSTLRPMGMQVSFQNTFSSFLEGLLARGDARTGDMILAAWKKGARFDAWDDRLDRHAWEAALAETHPDLADPVLAGFDRDAPLPWDQIRMGLSPRHLKREAERSDARELTPRCLPDCAESCGICGNETRVVHGEGQAEVPAPTFPEGWEGPVMASGDGTENNVEAMVFRFAKWDSAAWLPHLALAQVLERALQRSGIPYRLSPGFSPHPVMELGQALSLGIPSLGEWALIQLGHAMDGPGFAARMNRNLPEGIRIREALPLQALRENRRCPSLGSLLDRSSYLVRLSGSCPSGAREALEALPGTLLLADRPAARDLVASIQQADGISPEESGRLLDLHFPGDNGSDRWMTVDADREHATLRRILEPVLGPDWQQAGVDSLRLSLHAGEKSLGQACRDWGL